MPGAEIWVGVRTPGTELPERATRIEERCVAPGTGGRRRRHDDDVLLRVHDPRLVEHLRTVWAAGSRPASRSSPARTASCPTSFPTAGMLDGLPEREPTAVHAAAGRWCYDTMTLVGPGTWEAGRARVRRRRPRRRRPRRGRRSRSPTRSGLRPVPPPGHHVTRAAYGGSCYLNNAGIAAQALRDAGPDRVAIVDIDAHHGNGTQALFYDRADVLYASLHVDPGAGWFPHYAGFADETGPGAGSARTSTCRCAALRRRPWLAAVDGSSTPARRGADALVVSLGVDAAADDPESPLQVTHDGYEAAGPAGGLGLPTVAVQEGGYHLDTLGDLVADPSRAGRGPHASAAAAR